MKALEGIRIIDFTQAMAAPFATMNLADMGADVIKIEPPRTGEPTRELSSVTQNGHSATFMTMNRDKRGLTVDLKEIQRIGAALARSLRCRKEVRVESNAGTSLQFEMKRVPPIVSDGIVSPADIRRGFVRTDLPAGRLEAAVRPESVHGEIRATDPIPFAGRAIVRPWFQIHSGKIIESGAAEHDELLHRILRQSKVETARIGHVTIGLNPVAEACMLDNSIVKDDVGIGFGPHPQLERGAVDPSVSFDCTIGPVRIEIGS